MIDIPKPIAVLKDGSCYSYIDISFLNHNTFKHIFQYKESGEIVAKDFERVDDFIIIDNSIVAYEGQKNEIVIPDGIKNISKEAFGYYDSLTSLIMPDTVTFIDDDAFYGCLNLENITLSQNLTTIGSYAFGNCTRLTTIVIPKSVTHIDFAVFDECENLENIIYTGTMEEWNMINKDAYWAYWVYSIPATEVICSDGVVSLNG